MGEVQDVRDVKKTFVAPAIKSFEHYDFSRAKMCCSLTWLVAKAYGTGRSITAPTATVNRTQHESVYDFNAFDCLFLMHACQNPNKPKATNV